MLHATYGNNPSSASIALLVKETSFNADNIKSAYIDPLGANPAGFVAYSLWYDENGKCPATLAKDYLQTLLHSVQQLGIDTILVTDAKYFKYITGEQKAASNFFGYATKSTIKNFENVFTVFYAPNFHAAQYNPKTGKDLSTALSTFKNFLTGGYTEPGANVIHTAQYPDTAYDIKFALDWLLTQPKLTVDIETKSLEFWNCGIATIAFAWDKHNFISIPVDHIEPSQNDIAPFFKKVAAASVKKMLVDFFEAYTGTLIAHNAGYDFKVLTYELWMQNLQDYKGMIEGIEILTRDFEDTKIIAYLATNNAVENVLGLKPLSAEYMGNYAENVTDTTIIPLPDLLEYNGKDCLATWYVHDKYMPIMLADNQQQIYLEEFKPSVITLLATELTGMPIFPDKVAVAKKKLTALSNKYTKTLENSQLIKEFQLDVKARKCQEFTDAAKKKVFDLSDPRITRLEFNSNSGPQVAELLYTYLGFPIIDTTDTGEPATGGKTLEKLLNHTTNPYYITIIEALLGLTSVEKILNSFIPAFENAVQMPDGSWRLYGNFNLGGALSGRLSSSNPNLQNFPSNSLWGKLIKECFGCIEGWLFGGADFNSLEDMVSALTTRDTNKMKVYLDGYDGHSLRAYAYFKDQMPDIVDTVTSINSIKKKYDGLRYKSKGPTFLLTYGGTYHGLMNNLGLDKIEAQLIEDNFKILYKESIDYIAALIQQARSDGYVTGAFGLRLRTPLLKMSTKGKLSYKAAAEGRTAGNMLGQSYGMLNSRAANEFRKRVWESNYAYDILLCAQIHDACYIMWRNTAGITKWVNDNLISCMQWDGLVELQHPTVKLGAALDIYYPDWSIATEIRNGMTRAEIIKLCKRSP